MKPILFLLAFFLSIQFAQADAVIFSGSDVKALKSNLDLNGGAKVLSASTDPTAASTDATRGSILLNTGGGTAFIKNDSGSTTNWNRLVFGNSSGVVGIAQGGTGQTTANAGFNALSPMTTGGDIIYGGASGVATRLANGSAGQFLRSAGGTSAPTWSSTFVSATSSGDLTLSGGGIVFPATQVASAGANTLDDYEEGTWSPAYNTGFPATGTGQTARYTKVGDLIYVYVNATWRNDGTAVVMGGLPFAPARNSGHCFGQIGPTTVAIYQCKVNSGSNISYQLSATFATSTDSTLGATYNLQ